jgi:biopolymer transport protein ExbD
MKSSTLNSQGKSKRFAISVTFLLAAVFLTVIGVHSQQLQKGISVEMAPTNNAQPMPAADEQNAWIVSVTNEGRLWFGVTPVTRTGLVDEMIRTPRNRDQNLYIKADARAPYADVAYALKAARTAAFEAPVLLTAQPESPQPGTMVPPKGLEVWVGSESAGPKPVLVEVLSSKQDLPMLKVDDHLISWDNLQSTMGKLFQGQAQKMVVLRADGVVPFAKVAHVIDACRATGAKVVVTTPEI